MSHFLRGKQSGIHGDLSAGLAPEHFVFDDVARYGINSRISALAYDPVQSLLAVGTSETQYGSGQIYIFGQERVSAVFTLPRKASVNILQFCTDKIVSVDSKHELCVFSLEKRTKLAAYTPPGHVTALLMDPSLEYAFIGLQSGELVTYDLDRLMIAPFKLPNLWKERSPRSRLLPIVSLAFHPRDIGKLLIGYLEGAVTFSIKMNVPTKYFQYEVPPGAPGGDSDPSSSREVRRPRLTKAVWHPTGTFILTAHDDSSLVIWDPKDGRVVMARTLVDVDVNKPGTVASPSSSAGTYSLKEPIFQVAWCCKENPDDTGLLIAGGGSTTEVNKHLTFFDLGPTPNYQTSSWQVLSNHLAKPRRESKLSTPPAAEVVDFVLIPRSSPFFANAQDPIAVITLLSSGELVTLSFPSGHPISPTNMLHLSLSFVHPFVNKIALSYVDRTRWLGWTEKRAHGPNIVIGGAPAKKPMKRYENRDIVQTAHADGVIRMWDSGHDDHIENPTTIQVDLARAVGRFHNIEVSAMSLAGAAGEFSVGMKSGEVAIFKWGRNPNEGRDLPSGENDGPGQLTDISHRTDPGLKEGFIPLVLLNQGQGTVTALDHSDVGFICVGFQSGSLAIIDLRGPSVIFTAKASDFARPQKRLSIRKSHHSASEASPEWPTCIKFSVMTLEGDDYSSILCLVGTSKGNFATFKILPSGGAYTVSFAGSRSVDDRVLSICPIGAETGVPALASQEVVANLRNGYQVNGVVIAVTPSGCRMFKPSSAKGAEKDWDDFLCDYATVVRAEERSSLVGVFGDGKARAYSIPALKEIASSPIDKILDMRRVGEAVISPSGDVIGWTGPSELAMLSLWGAGLPLRWCDDAIYNPMLSAPSRPTISNLQWISGTQYVTPADMDLLIGGPDRPPSKHMIEQMRQEEMSRQSELRGSPQGSSGNASQARGASEEGYWAYMQRQMQQRTENLNIMGDSIDRLEETSSGWAEDVNKYVKNQKKKAVLGVIGSKFGF